MTTNDASQLCRHANCQMPLTPVTAGIFDDTICAWCEAQFAQMDVADQAEAMTTEEADALIEAQSNCAGGKCAVI